MTALARNFGFAAACVLARLAAVLVAGVATAWNVRAFLLVCLCHSSPPRLFAAQTLVAEILPTVA
jgi:hypothetical protein